ncbi:MAG: hypothetical protein CMK59_09330 [Proteobacteria bacterium]|nr:hypothetical protein [Pseudomonadota bacterium]
MSYLPKAQSVDQKGALDGFFPPMAFNRQVLEGGYTRIELSVPPDKLAVVHKQLAEQISFPCKIRYLKLTDRIKGQLPDPESYVAVEISKDRLMQVLTELSSLIHYDGRHQFWVVGHKSEQIILDELGMIYIYPDDFLFRDVLSELGFLEAAHENMASRDYVRVNFLPIGDQQENVLFQSLGFVRWEG